MLYTVSKHHHWQEEQGWGEGLTSVADDSNGGRGVEEEALLEEGHAPEDKHMCSEVLQELREAPCGVGDLEEEEEVE